MSSLDLLRRRAFNKGVLGGSRVWMAVGAALWTARALRWAVRSSPERVFRGDLRPGETLVISSRPAPPTRRQRRRRRRRERASDRRAVRAERRSGRRSGEIRR